MNNVDFYTMIILLLPLLCAVMIFLAQGLAVATSGRVYYKGMKDIMRHLNALATLYNIVLRMKTYRINTKGRLQGFVKKEVQFPKD